MKRRRLCLLLVTLGLGLSLLPFRAKVRFAIASMIRGVRGQKTVSDRVAEFGDVIHGRLGDRFRQIGVSYPPKRVVLVGLKQERALEVWVADDSSDFRYLRTYPILGTSGTLGPKLREGDGQIPEGLYRIESLNPNSLYHLALRVNYPNSFDKAKGASDGRTQLGSDIMIHGNSVSVGCLATGDPAAEDLFVLAAETGIERISVILSPVDFRVRELPSALPGLPPWAPELYQEIRKELAKLVKRPV